MNLMKQLLNDEAGFIVSTELVLIATIVILGLIVGLGTLRNGVIQELADVSGSIGNINQGYNFAGLEGSDGADGDNFFVSGSTFADTADFCETGDNANGGADGDGPGCLNLAGPTGVSETAPAGN